MLKILKKIIFKIIPKKSLIAMINRVLIFIFLDRWLRNRSICKGPITIVGMLRSNSGLGKAARLTMDALKKHKLGLTCFDVSKFFNASMFSITLPPKIRDDEGGVIIIQNSSIHLPFVLFLLGRKKIARKKIIAYVAWELDVLPSSWITASRLVDEIWVPSLFVARSFRKEVDMPPISVVPHPLNVIKSGNGINLASDIKRYPKKVLNISTLGPQFNRKNVGGLIKIFKKLYHASQEVCLVLKISGYDVQQREKLDAIIKNSKNIFVLDKKLSESQLYGLIEESSILVSLHRSEGFGLCVAEAMMLKTPVITTNWSASVEFFDNDRFLVKYKLIPVDDPYELSSYEYSKTPKWAEPDYKDAEQKIEKLLGDNDILQIYAEESYRSINSFLFKKNVFLKIVNRSLDIG